MNINVNVMDIKADIKWIQKELKDVKDPTLIEAFKNLLEYRKKVMPERIGIEQYNKELDESIAQIDRGELYTQQEVGERIKRWAKK